MAVNIQVKRGLSQNLPSKASSGTPLWCEDTHELYFGTGNSIVKIGENSTENNLYEKTLKPIIFPELIDNNYNLTSNSINRVTVNSDCKFSLPFLEDGFDKFHQILVQVNLEFIASIDLGTDCFFNEEVPNMSKPGFYNLIYEYNGSYWVVGCIKSGVV